MSIDGVLECVYEVKYIGYVWWCVLSQGINVSFMEGVGGRLKKFRFFASEVSLHTQHRGRGRRCTVGTMIFPRAMTVRQGD